MFRLISLISFAAVFGGIFLHHVLFPCGYEKRFAAGSIVRKKVHLFTLLFLEQSLGWAGRFRKLAFLLGLLSFFVLAMTGFLPLMLGGKLQGYLLMIHATFAPVFIACAAFIALTGAGQYAFKKADADAIPAKPLACKCGSDEGCWLTDTGVGAKAGFWVLLVLTLPVTLTMVLSMLPLFGPEGQEFLFHAHRWFTLIFALTAIIELYMLVRIGVLKDTK